MATQKSLKPERSDGELWRRFVNGDLSAFETIYNENFEKLYRYGMTLLPDEPVVKDCIQALFIELWENVSNLSSIDQIRFYLLKALRNRIYNQLKAIKRRSSFLDNLSNQRLIGMEDASTETGDRFGNESDLRTVINELPMRQREAIMLIFFEGYTYEAASEVLSINIQSLYTLVSRAVANLRANLK
ncbi:MAG TPA: sigma-70 family RNA polymerase sigma factor [Cyclobacteriaceae bacterium]|nr:sigma-70 family RNA polymerase sigma factor [Cyclobacteriaceae bacterium]